MLTDSQLSRFLKSPTKWEESQYLHASRADKKVFERLFDEALRYRDDASVLRQVECSAGTSFGGTRVNVFRALFLKDIGGVSGASDSWFDASNYTVDGGTGKVLSFVDYIDTSHTITQSTAANQVAIPVADATMNNSLTATFVTATVNYYDSSRAASFWKYCHDGSGKASIHTLTPQGVNDNVICSTYDISSGTTQAGTYEGFTSTASPRPLIWLISNGTTSPANGRIVNINGSVNVPASTPTSLVFTYKNGGSPEYELRNKISVLTSGSDLGTPSSGDPGGTLRLGANRGASPLAITMKWRSSFFFRRVPTAAERLIYQAWISAQTGISF